MSKSKSYKSGGGLVAICFTVASIALPETGWLNPEVARWAFILAIFGIIIGGLLWIIGRRYQTEEKQLVRTIPQIINDMHILRGEFTDKYNNDLDKNTEAIQIMNGELYSYLGGIEIPKTIDNVEDVFSTIENVFKSLPVMKDKSESVSDLELARLLAESAKTHLPVETNLGNNRGYKKLSKVLKKAREQLIKGIAVEATKVIDFYLTYSKGYWALDVLIADITKQVGDTESLMQTAYNLYRNKFQEQMNLNLAKVCEVINAYDK